MIRQSSVLLLAASLALSIAGCGTTGGKATTASIAVVDEQSTDPAVKKAVEVYKNQCLVCHGSQLEGKMGAKSGMKNVGTKLTKDQIKDKILKGGGGMIGYKDRLSEDEINALTDWLSTKK
jgi:cytochrome c551